eukprot:TRINITY_DN5683_c2_g3_i1.p1 TRINITY_DN5683_c2_g3~~TRINITY_DN5683_c2_g3_i1.p1  ORF type:complete len:163 (-),score=25.56 TRINITY_DN5683_c2_g3_i1:24-452(-)
MGTADVTALLVVLGGGSSSGGGGGGSSGGALCMKGPVHNVMRTPPPFVAVAASTVCVSPREPRAGAVSGVLQLGLGFRALPCVLCTLARVGLGVGEGAALIHFTLPLESAPLGNKVYIKMRCARRGGAAAFLARPPRYTLFH